MIVSTPSYILWRPVVGFEDYEVSEFGQVRRAAPGVNTHPGKVLSCNITAHGYRRAHLYKDGKIHSLSVNRIVCEAFNGPPPTPRHHSAHNDGNRLNNKYTNLRWATARENCMDKVVHGTMASGSRNGNAKLKAEDVEFIRSSPKVWAHNKIMAEKFNVSVVLIEKIRASNSVLWKGVGR